MIAETGSGRLRAKTIPNPTFIHLRGSIDRAQSKTRESAPIVTLLARRGSISRRQLGPRERALSHTQHHKQIHMQSQQALLSSAAMTTQ